MGPLISAAHRDLVDGFVRRAAAQGAKLCCGGQAKSGDPWDRGSFYEPAVFCDVDPGLELAREEIFGPVVAILPFETEDEAIRLANGSIYGLSGSLWTRDIGRAMRVMRAVETGVLSVNSSSSVHLEMPFGGVKRSGDGRELGPAALDHYSEWKSVFIASD
jgi:betaine-aldehyde dehydrogenase